MKALIITDSNIMHGTPCFAGTRVAVQSLFDHLEAGCTIDDFLAEFPTVKRDQVMACWSSLGSTPSTNPNSAGRSHLPAVRTN